MLNHSTLDYLTEIQSHGNDKEWFEANRDRYENVLEDLTALAAALLNGAEAFDAGVLQANPDPRACVSRIHRDMRFNKGNKPRYKDDFFITLYSEPGDAIRPAYYVHVQPKGNYAGGGLYGPDSKQLDRLRTAVVDRRDRWHDVTDDTTLQRVFPEGIVTPESLKIAPHGYDVDDPDIEYLRMKGFAVNRPLTRQTLESKACVEELVSTFKAARPLVDFCNDAIR